MVLAPYWMADGVEVLAGYSSTLVASHFARLMVGVKEEITDVGTLEHTVDVTPPAVFAWKVTVPGPERTTGVWTTVVNSTLAPILVVAPADVLTPIATGPADASAGPTGPAKIIESVNTRGVPTANGAIRRRTTHRRRESHRVLMILTGPADVAPLVPIIPPAFDRGHCLAVAAWAIVPLPQAET